MRYLIPALFLVFAVLFMCSLLLGCGSSVNPYAENERAAAQCRQKIRENTPDPPPLPEPPAQASTVDIAVDGIQKPQAEATPSVQRSQVYHMTIDIDVVSDEWPEVKHEPLGTGEWVKIGTNNGSAHVINVRKAGQEQK